MTTQTTVRVSYETVPNSNVGKYVARANGRQRSSRCDQSLSSERNAEQAALRLLGVLYPERLILHRVTLTDQNDSGTRRVYTATT